MIKAVLFDLDGTLLNTIEDLSDAVNYMLNQFGYKTFSVEEYKYKVGNGMPKLMERSLPEDKRTPQDIKEALDVFMPYYSEHKMDKTAAYEGIIDLLKSLKEKGIKTAIVTNKAHKAACDLAKEVFSGLFDTVCGQKDGVPTKPDPASVYTTIQQLGVNAKECLFVGDSGVDMQTAKNSGIKAVGVLWGFRKADELVSNGADEIINTPSELLKFI